MSVLRDAYQIIAGSGLNLAITSSEVTDTVIKSQVYIVTTNTDCYVRFSGSAVTSSDGNFDIFLPAGAAAVLRATNSTIRAIRDSADGTLGVSRLEVV